MSLDREIPPSRRERERAKNPRVAPDSLPGNDDLFAVGPPPTQLIPPGMLKVISTNLAAIGFFAAGEEPSPDRLTYINDPEALCARQTHGLGRLEVLFLNDQLWAYENISLSTITEMLTAVKNRQSVGHYFNMYIRNQAKLYPGKQLAWPFPWMAEAPKGRP